MIMVDVSVIIENIDLLWGGLLMTFKLFIVALVGGLPLGIFLGLGRLSSRKWIYYPVSAYVHFIRNVPLLMLIFWIYFSLPILTGGLVEPFYAAVVSFIIFEATYFGEIIRAGYQSVSKGTIQAAYSTGLNYWQMARYILIPIALRRVVPSMITQSIVLFQDTSLAYVIGLHEFVRMASLSDNRVIRPLELYGFVAIVFLVICSIGSQIVKRLETKEGERK